MRPKGSLPCPHAPAAGPCRCHFDLPHVTWNSSQPLTYSRLMLLSSCLCGCVPPTAARQGFGSVYPFFGVRQRRGKHVAGSNTHNNRRIVVPVIFYGVHVLLKENLWVVCVCPCRRFETTQRRRSRVNEDLLKASFSMQFMSYKRKQVVQFFSWYVYDYITNLCSAGNKQKSYKIMRINMFGV
jgi:hypothetical protein